MPKQWLEVERDTFHEALVALSNAPILPGRRSKKRDKLQQELRLILLWEKQKLVLVAGAFSSRLKARGSWKSAAVLPFQALDVLTALVQQMASGETIRLEGGGGKLRFGRVEMSCIFGDPEPYLAGVDEAERDLQRIVEKDALVGAEGPRTSQDPGIMLSQLREVSPTCFLLPLDRETAVAFPDCPRLLLNFRKFRVEIRRVTDSNAEQALWLEQSELAKSLTYAAVHELGISNLLPYAAKLVQIDGQHVESDE
jgi:hypothetical protein